MYRVAIFRNGNDIGIGIERYNKSEIEFIGSYYLQASKFSRRDTFRFIADKIRAQLSDGESATIRIADPILRYKRTWYAHYADIKVVTYNFKNFETAHVLCEDAVIRKTTIEEELI